MEEQKTNKKKDEIEELKLEIQKAKLKKELKGLK